MFILPRTMPGSTWSQKFSGSAVLFVLALVCFVIGWTTGLQILVTVAYLFFIIVALMGLYALCFTTKLSKGVHLSGPTTVVHVQPPQHGIPAVVYPQMATIAMPPGYSQAVTPAFNPTYANDKPPPYSAAVNQPPPYP